MRGQYKNLDDLHQNQIEIEKSTLINRKKLDEHLDSITRLESTLLVTNKSFERHQEDTDLKLTGLTKRIDKAEEDRMSKYYKQVSHLQDWVDKWKIPVAKNSEFVDSLSNHFCQENQILIYNIVTETLSKCLEGRPFNKFVEYMRLR